MDEKTCTLCDRPDPEGIYERISWEGQNVLACFECCCALGVV